MLNDFLKDVDKVGLFNLDGITRLEVLQFDSSLVTNFDYNLVISTHNELGNELNTLTA